MSASLRALLEGVIDYAGLFPPAQLPLDAAFRNYVRYRDCPQSWMLGRFIIQAAKLPELGTLVKLLPADAPPLRLSVLGRGGPSLVELYQGLVEDFKAMQRIQAELSDRIAIDGFEVRLAPAVLHVLDDDPKCLRPGEASPGEPFDVLSMLIDAGKPGVFLEIGLEGDWRQNLGRLLERIDHAGTEGVRSSQVGVKLRCGGLDAAAFPTPEQIAAVITACRDVLVPLKFTAGLHHPLRQFNEGVKTEMHGFLNVFAAGVLAHRFHLAEDEVRQILEDEDARHFTFDDDGMGWKDRRVSVGEIKLARQLAVTSFGSCSFDEPRGDLRALGLLT